VLPLWNETDTELTLSGRYWGHAAASAYRAYGDANMLDIAEAVWQNVSAYQITASQAASGKHPLKSDPIMSTCNGGGQAFCGIYMVTVLNHRS
jgi:hypothetical protein